MQKTGAKCDFPNVWGPDLVWEVAPKSCKEILQRVIDPLSAMTIRSYINKHNYCWIYAVLP